MKLKLALAALALAALPALANAAPAHRVKQRVAENRIACTVLGCQPIPPQCTTTYSRSVRGTPTGYDVIVCPNGIWPLK